MTYLVDADPLSAVLERQVDFWVDQKGDRRIYLLPRFIEFVEREPRLSALLSEMREEARSAETSFDECAADLRTGLLEIWKRCHAQIADICKTALGSDTFNIYGRFGQYESDLRLSNRFEFAPERLLSLSDGQSLPIAKRLCALKHWCACAIQRLEHQNQTPSEELTNAQRDLRSLQRRYDRAFRELLVQDRTLGWLAYRRLRYWSSRLAPEPPPGNPDLSAEFDFSEADRDATVLHGGQPEPSIHTPVEVEELAGDIERDLHLLHHDLRIRLLMGHSRMALVRRYAARCEGYDAPRLRAVAARKPKTAENELRLDFARYLFDQGLCPILDGTIGALRPDVLDPTGATAIYVEAKQYTTKSPRAMLKAAVRQVWSTWARLRRQYDIPEAFLVVFRRAGPLISPDVMTVPYEGQKLHLVVVDIAADAGSRERHNPITIAAADLLPDLENGDRALARRRG